MKFLSGILLCSCLFFMGCTKTVTQVNEVDQAFSAIYTINPTDWQTTDGGKSFSVTFPIAELSQDIYDHGAVLAYISFDGNFYEALPEVFDGITYGATHVPGNVTVDLSALDGSTITVPTKPVTAKIILIDATPL